MDDRNWGDDQELPPCGGPSARRLGIGGNSGHAESCRQLCGASAGLLALVLNFQLDLNSTPSFQKPSWNGRLLSYCTIESCNDVEDGRHFSCDLLQTKLA